MRLTRAYAGVLAGVLASTLVPAVRADEFLAMPGLWKMTYEVEGVGGGTTGAPRVAWHCVDEEADPWEAFAHLQDLPGMACSRDSLHRTSTSLRWTARCRGVAGAGAANGTAGAGGTGGTAVTGGTGDAAADGDGDVVEVTGAIVFDSAQHYTGWVKFSGTLMGYPLHSGAKIDGLRRAACTSPKD